MSTYIYQKALFWFQVNVNLVQFLVNFSDVFQSVRNEHVFRLPIDEVRNRVTNHAF